MIIFDLDGTLTDCEHRRYLIDPKKNKDYEFIFDNLNNLELTGKYYHKATENKFVPKWQDFYEACDKDKPIESVCSIWNQYEVEIALDNRADLRVWSGRCESVIEKTIDWLDGNLFGLSKEWWNSILKMRPEGDSTPDDQLKEQWLDEVIAQGHKIDFVFDDRPKVVRMWQRRGIFVFNCNQSEGEF